MKRQKKTTESLALRYSNAKAAVDAAALKVGQIAADNGFIGKSPNILTAEELDDQSLAEGILTGLYDAVTGLPVVGGFVGDVISGVGDFLDAQNIQVVLSPSGATVTTSPMGGTSSTGNAPYVPIGGTTSPNGRTITIGVQTGSMSF
jgi:hypothetical protein